MLPAPHLDDRRFQDLVDDAKRRIAHHCPEWTDHNVSDPGVTLIESFAFMMDEISYRLNRVPDRLYVKFLDLLGVQLHAPAAATTELVVKLSAARPEAVVVPLGTEAATRRTDDDAAVVFQTTAELSIPPRKLAYLLAAAVDGEPVDRFEQLGSAAEQPVFSPQPAEGDSLLIGLDDVAANTLIALRFDCSVRGVGVDPRRPPLVWEAWTGKSWRACAVEDDGTGGLNKAGDVLLVLPAGHTASVLSGVRAGWIRCRVTAPEEGFSFYSASPVIRSLEAFSIGGVVPAAHAETVQEETLGISEGVPGQVFALAQRPMVDDGLPLSVEVATGSGWQRWQEVDSFAGFGDSDPVIMLDRSAGLVHFPPAVREADGSLRQFGALPPLGAAIRIPEYRVGGGPSGNLSTRAISVLRGSVPFVSEVYNRRPAQGGIAAETIAEAMQRGPLALRSRDRAVTAEDYEELALAAAPSIARVRCVPAAATEAQHGVRLLVVPAAAAEADGRLRFEDLVPSESVLQTIAGELEERRPIGARLVVEPPLYKGVTVVAKLIAKPAADRERLEDQAVEALYRFLDPVRGGPEGNGWPFGRPVHAGEVYALLQALPGVELVDDVLLFAADPISGERGDPVQKMALGSQELVFSFEHRVRIGAPL